ncbi:disks large homolog 5-like isoform X3 [Dreissena polymorpha]|uniref:disks large homolog 5-like isoform X3 n=1 Tax=Dreissena polymorpha TaxID=45954 RepID=UPI002263E32C|nr:disks large homolog 5-like isoform X3 [Dreissena polymorpha]
MEAKYKELIELHRLKFSAVVDADRLLPILEIAETLSNAEVTEINKLTVNKERVDKILDILLNKDNLAFKGLCFALENTYPHLLTVMFLGNSQRTTSASGSDVRPASIASDSEEDVLRRCHSSGDARSQDLKTYTRKIPSCEYDDFQDLGSLDGSLVDAHFSGAKITHSGRYKQGINGESRHRSHNRDYDWLKFQCERAMSELQALKMQQSDNTKRYDAVIKESDSYRLSYMSTLSQLQQTREDAEVMRGQNRDLVAENKRFEQEVKNLRKLREEDQKEMTELRKHQRDIVSKSGSSEVLNALDMYDRIKKDYDSLRDRYSDLVTQHSSLKTKFENSQEENVKLKKQLQVVCSERDSAILERNGLKQQCTAAIRNWDQVIHECNDMKEKIQKITQQRDDVMKEMNQALAGQLRAKKELELVQKDKDAVFREYNLIMSERDQVHKEIEQLNERLSQNEASIETLQKDKKSAQDEAETLKREITSALQDRDKSVKERNELSEKCNELLSKQSAIEKQREEYKKEVEMSIQQRDIARKERQEAMQDRDRILREKYEREQFQKENADKMDQYNRETEQLKLRIEKLNQQLQDGVHEAEIAKNRRDWAMSERDKIVQERDSMRTLCDSLRRDRDRAVSDLAQSIRDFDEMKKQKHEAVRELKEYRDKYELVNEKESRKSQLNSVVFCRDKYELVNEKESRKSQLNSVAHNHSRDSAIDADMQEFETETLEIELSGLNKEDVGFELVGGKDDPQYPNDNSLFVSHVVKGSPAENKLRLNDQVLRINNKDVCNVEKRFAYNLLRNRSGTVAMQVMRRRKISPSRSWQAIQLSIPPGKDIGIQLENGLYVTRVNPGSYAAKEGLITVGDRIISVNGRSVENMSPEDLQKTLFQCGGDTILLDVWRQTTPLSSAGSSPIPLGAPLQEPLLCPSSKSDPSKRWDSASEGSKGSLRNIKSSGSQTDSLDSPSVMRRGKERKQSDKDSDHKARHSVHIFDKALETVDKIFKSRNKSTERIEIDKGTLTPSRPRTMIENSVDIVEFAFPMHTRENSNASSTTRNSGRPNEEVLENVDQEMSNTGTWPKCYRFSNATVNGTVIQTQKNHHKRPSIEAVIDRTGDQGFRVPPLPPERKNSSFVAARHTPQNSDSTITYSSHPPSPSLSPQPSNASSSVAYFPKSPAIPRHTFIHQHQDSINTPPPSQSYHSPPGAHTPHQAHKPTRLTGNLKSPPRIPQVSTNQYDLKSSSNHANRMRPPSGVSVEQKSLHSNVVYISPTSHNPPSHIGSRNSTPEPYSPTKPIEFIDRPIGRHYAMPNSYSSNSLPTPSQPVVARQHDNVHHATTTVLPPRFNPHAAFLPDSIDLENLPPYPSGMSEVSSPSPSLISEVSRFTPNHMEYPYPSYPYYQEHRYRNPSIPSVNVSINDTSGSIVSDGDLESMCSPFQEMHKMLPQSSLPLDHSLPRRKPSKPKLHETRTISFEKTLKPVGFQIEMGPVSGGIFVRSVNENSQAAMEGLVVGDQLLEICAINMRNATYDLAARVLQQCGSNLTMLVQYNPEKYLGGNYNETSAPSSPEQPPKVQDHNNPRVRLPARDSTRGSIGKYDAQRNVSFKKPNPTASLGLSLAGGNATGIFIQNIEENSPAHNQNVLAGDQILEFNGIDFTRATAEQAYRHLHEPCASVRLRLRYHPSLYSKVRDMKRGDSLYVRAMIDHVADKDGELSFRRDDLLHIEDTMYGGQQGVWYAWIISDTGEKIKGGTIPSKDRLEDDISLHMSESMSLPDSDEFKTRRGSGSARRSFWRRNKKHQRNNSKDSRDFNSCSDASLNSDSLPVLDDSSTYLSVERLEYKKTRPVVLIAPLADALIQKLSSESPDKYFYCQATVMQTSQSEMLDGLKDGRYIDFWQQEDRFHCIRLKSVTDICDQKIHCLLNVNPAAIERLQRQQIYPIVIYARHKSYKSLREIKDVQFLPEKLTIKASKELYEYFLKAEQDYRHLISATIQGGNLAEMAQQIKNVIASEQEKPIWVPSSTLR